MSDFTASIDISPSDYIYECSDYEIKELITELKESGYLKGDITDTDDESNEDEEIIRNISKKLI